MFRHSPSCLGTSRSFQTRECCRSCRISLPQFARSLLAARSPTTSAGSVPSGAGGAAATPRTSQGFPLEGGYAHDLPVGLTRHGASRPHRRAASEVGARLRRSPVGPSRCLRQGPRVLPRGGAQRAILYGNPKIQTTYRCTVTEDRRPPAYALRGFGRSDGTELASRHGGGIASFRQSHDVV